jgi:hypothetical protein
MEKREDPSYSILDNIFIKGTKYLAMFSPLIGLGLLTYFTSERSTEEHGMLILAGSIANFYPNPRNGKSLAKFLGYHAEYLAERIVDFKNRKKASLENIF